MSLFDRDKFDDFILSNNCVGFFEEPIKLKSERLCNYYVNLRNLMRTVGLKRDTARFVYQFAMDKGLRPDVFIGVPEGATPLGESVTELIDYRNPYEVPAVIMRAVPKDHGNPIDRETIGRLEPGYHVVVNEDVTTTGKSTAETIERISKTGAIIDSVLGCVDRLERRDDGRMVSEYFKEKYGVEYVSMTDAAVLVQKAYKMLNPPRHVADAVEKYFREHSPVHPILR